MYDVIVAGGGPAGLSASLMLGRCRRRVLLCDTGEPRNRFSHALHGYLTRDGIPPADFNSLARAELTRYGVECRRVGVTEAQRLDGHFRVRLADGQTEEARFLLLATGVTDERPSIPGFDACYGRSVHHCPYCDGWEWRDRPLAVLGKGSSGAALAMSLKTWSADVTLCLNGSRLERRGRQQLERNGIVLRAAPVTGLEHVDGMLNTVTFRSGSPLKADALFFTSGQHPHCNLAKSMGCTFNRRGTVNTGLLSNTNVPGVFVAGDASRDAQFVVVAAAEGVKAAMAINQAIQKADLVS